MAFIVDASAAAGWFLPDEQTAFSNELAGRMEEEDVLVPDLFWHEARNFLLKALRAGRMDEAGLYVALDRLATLPLRDAGPNDALSVTRLAVKHQLSAYDGAYLDLAVQHHLPLATLDKTLKAAARLELVTILEP